MIDDPTAKERDFAADVLEAYSGDTLDADRMGELIAEVAHALASMRNEVLDELGRLRVEDMCDCETCIAEALGVEW